jgi:hypothetical protein
MMVCTAACSFRRLVTFSILSLSLIWSTVIATSGPVILTSVQALEMIRNQASASKIARITVDCGCERSVSFFMKQSTRIYKVIDFDQQRWGQILDQSLSAHIPVWQINYCHG